MSRKQAKVLRRTDCGPDAYYVCRTDNGYDVKLWVNLTPSDDVAHCGSRKGCRAWVRRRQSPIRS